MIRYGAFTAKKERGPRKWYASKTHTTIEMKVTCDCGLRVTYHVGDKVAKQIRFDLMREHAGHKLNIKTEGSSNASSV